MEGGGGSFQYDINNNLKLFSVKFISFDFIAIL